MISLTSLLVLAAVGYAFWLFSDVIKCFISIATVVVVGYLFLAVFLAPEQLASFIDSVVALWQRHTQPDLLDEVGFRLHILARNLLGGY